MAVCEPRPNAPVDAERLAGGVDSFSFKPKSHTLAWERLEKSRLHSLGMPNRFSRHLNAYTQNNAQVVMYRSHEPLTFEQSLRAPAEPAPSKANTNKVGTQDIAKSNSLAPFYTCGKPTCGYFFSRITDNKKRDFGIPPSDLVAWRSFSSQ